MIACRSTSIRSRHCQALKTVVNKYTLATGQEQADSSAAQRHNKDSTACNFKDHEDKDVMLGASNHYKLPISYFYTTAGRLRDVIATISAHAARLNSRAHKLSYDWDLMTFNPDISTGHRRVVDAMIVDRTGVHLKLKLNFWEESKPVYTYS